MVEVLGKFVLVGKLNRKNPAENQYQQNGEIMRRLSILLIATLFMAACSVPKSSVLAAQPIYLSGLAKNDATRPDLHENITGSKYLATKDAGIIQLGKRAGFYWFLVLKEKPLASLYIKVTYPNPNGGNPLINDIVLTAKNEELRLSSPDFVTGLKGGETYKIQLQVFESKESITPIDELTQNIFSLISN